MARKINPESLRFYRKKAGLTQKELADIVGKQKNSISSIERGVFDAGDKLIIAFSKALNIKAEQLCHTDNAASNPKSILSDIEIQLIADYRNLSAEQQINLSSVAHDISEKAVMNSKAWVAIRDIIQDREVHYWPETSRMEELTESEKSLLSKVAKLTRDETEKKKNPVPGKGSRTA